MTEKRKTEVSDDKSYEKLGPYGFHTEIARMRLVQGKEPGASLIEVVHTNNEIVIGYFLGSDPSEGVLTIYTSEGVSEKVRYRDIGNVSYISLVDFLSPKYKNFFDELQKKLKLKKAGEK